MHFIARKETAVMLQFLGEDGPIPPGVTFEKVHRRLGGEEPDQQGYAIPQAGALPLFLTVGQWLEYEVDDFAQPTKILAVREAKEVAEQFVPIGMDEIGMAVVELQERVTSIDEEIKFVKGVTRSLDGRLGTLEMMVSKQAGTERVSGYGGNSGAERTEFDHSGMTQEELHGPIAAGRHRGLHGDPVTAEGGQLPSVLDQMVPLGSVLADTPNGRIEGGVEIVCDEVTEHTQEQQDALAAMPPKGFPGVRTEPSMTHFMNGGFTAQPRSSEFAAAAIAIVEKLAAICVGADDYPIDLQDRVESFLQGAGAPIPAASIDLAPPDVDMVTAAKYNRAVERIRELAAINGDAKTIGDGLRADVLKLTEDRDRYREALEDQIASNAALVVEVEGLQQKISAHEHE